MPTPDPARRDALRRYLSAAIAILAGLLASAVVIIDVSDDDHDGRPDHVTATVATKAPSTVAVDGPDADLRRDDHITLTKAAKRTYENVADAPRSELNVPLREPGDTTPVGVLDGPLATPEFPGCRTRFVRNFSERVNGAQPQVIVWHQTVSHENGWASQDGLTARANDPRTMVSWHLLIGRSDGRCTYTVPLDKKAWAQGWANSISVGIEVEAYGDEPSYVTGAGKAKLLTVTRHIGQLEHIPMQHGKVVFDRDCRARVVRRGIIEHSELGACGGGHVDVTPWDTSSLIAAAAKDPCPARCRRAHHLRARHHAAHTELRRRHCAPAARTRSARCRLLHHRNTALHTAARKEHIKL